MRQNNGLVHEIKMFMSNCRLTHFSTRSYRNLNHFQTSHFNVAKMGILFMLTILHPVFFFPYSNKIPMVSTSRISDWFPPIFFRINFGRLVHSGAPGTIFEISTLNNLFQKFVGRHVRPCRALGSNWAKGAGRRPIRAALVQSLGTHWFSNGASETRPSAEDINTISFIDYESSDQLKTSTRTYLWLGTLWSSTPTHLIRLLWVV